MRAAAGRKRRSRSRGRVRSFCILKREWVRLRGRIRLLFEERVSAQRLNGNGMGWTRSGGTCTTPARRRPQVTSCISTKEKPHSDDGTPAPRTHGCHAIRRGRRWTTTEGGPGTNAPQSSAKQLVQQPRQQLRQQRGLEQQQGQQWQQ